MDQLLLNSGFPILTVLIFLPLAGALALLFVSGDQICRLFTLAVTSIVALLSLRVLAGFDTGTAKFQFVEHHRWIEAFNINYTIGVDGFSFLLLLLITLIMPFCVLASWTYFT